jgi:hypothetical protein
MKFVENYETLLKDIIYKTILVTKQVFGPLEH